jgi:DNA polymerase (family X)
MENVAVARILGEIADLLEVRGENPFKIRAYRNAAACVADAPERIADLPVERLREYPGIGKDLAARIRELATTGAIEYHQQLLQQVPPTLLELLELQGLGPKTVALLHASLAIASLDGLEQAAREGRLTAVRGIGPKKVQAILKAIHDRRQFAGRHLLWDARQVAEGLLAYLRERAPEADLDVVGSLRRGCETCGDLDLLASGAGPDLMDAFVTYRLVERVYGRGETKSSVRLWKGYQADLRLVARESRGAALQYFTGSKAHNIELRDRAMQRGLKLNEYGLFTLSDDRRVAGATEEDVYAALDLAWVPPELRENRGEIEAAAAGTLPRLVQLADLRGDLHMHTTETDGRDGIETMAIAARELGYEYIAITDHSQSLAMANGLDERRALAHAAQVREVGKRVGGIRLLAGIECDIRPDGTLDLDEHCLARLDYVVASVHSAFAQDEAQMTGRLLRAIENPCVDAVGHPTGRLILRREGYRVDLAQVADAAAAHGVALEINGQSDRLDLSDVHARFARQRGARMVLATDAHSTGALRLMPGAVTVARRAWLTPGDILNTRPLDEFLGSLRRHQ